jgi:hypothetical protein
VPVGGPAAGVTTGGGFPVVANQGLLIEAAPVVAPVPVGNQGLRVATVACGAVRD